MKKKNNLLATVLIFFCLTIGLILRLYNLNSAIADHHSHRQADTASVSRHLLQKTGTFLIPTYHDISNVQSGLDNPHGYRMVEMPIYNSISVYFYKIFQPIFPNLNIEISSRLVSVIFSLLSASLIFSLVYKYSHLFWPAYLSMLTFLINPFSVYYSRTILPQSTAIFFMLLSLNLFNSHIFLASISLSLAILTSPFTAILAFPVLIFLGLQKYPKQKISLTIFHFVLFSTISLIPFLLWRNWTKHFIAGVPFNKWLFIKDRHFLGVNNWTPDPPSTFWQSLIPFKAYWFKWLFLKRISQLILGTFGVVPLFLSFVYRHKKIPQLLISFWSAITIYFISIAGGNIQHDYYQSLILPYLFTSIGIGLYYISRYTFTNKLIAKLSVILILIIFNYLSFDQIKEFYKINNPIIIEAGQKVQQLIPKSALVIAPYTGDTAFLYQTQHSGWPTQIYDVKKLFANQAIYLVSTTFDNYTQKMISKYPSIYKDKKFVILKIYTPPNES
ncbi:hypothetical protein DRH14_01365 [Candidatus Shapirobacteria bacterium]|nr:MAG: hypothetical protein DRH14_01365 [Candidatus Shapirobacteria bacterium]